MNTMNTLEKIKAQAAVVYTEEALHDMTLPALAALYNEKAKGTDFKPVTRFPSKAVAVEKVMALLKLIGDVAVPEPPVPEPPIRTRAQWDKQPTAQPKEPRADTKRAIVLELLLRKGGATFEEVAQALNAYAKRQKRKPFTHKEVYRAVRGVNSRLGYGLRQKTPDGPIMAYKK